MKLRHYLLSLFICTLVLGCADTARQNQVLTRVNGGFDPTRYSPPSVTPLKANELLPKSISFSMTPYFSIEVHRNIVSPIAAHLEKHLNIPVVVKEAENYRDLIDETIKGEVDVALISPLAFILAKEENPQLDLLAAVVAQGTTTYSGYLVTPSQSDIFSINDAQGKKLALVDPVSTSGSLFPLLFFQQQGINIDNYFAKTSFAGTHDKALALIREKQVDIAAVSSDTLVAYNALGPGGFARIVAKTGRAPYDALVANPKLPKKIREEIKTIFLRLSIHTQEGRAILAKKNLLSGFIPVTESHYETVKAAARAGGLIQK